jgi:amidohydrolase
VESLQDIRRYLHQHPELSGKEYATQAFLKKQLQALHGGNLIEVGNTGLLLTIKAKRPGKSLLLRADIDALPMEEANTDIPYRSQNKGISHKCGHDGHTTILLGVARYFAREGLKQGTLHLLFQPSEEDGRGAQMVLNDPHFKNIKYDAAYALHNMPGYPIGQVLFKPGFFTAGVISVAYEIRGTEAHAAEPEKAVSPQAAMAEMMSLPERLDQADFTKEDYRQVTVVHARLGEKNYGITPGEGEIHYTIRAWQAKELKKLRKELDEQIKQCCRSYALSYEASWSHEFYPNQNDPNCITYLEEAAKKEALDAVEIEDPFRWGEDFGLFIQEKPGAYFCLGAGESTHNLHDPSYDFPDDLLDIGTKLFVRLSLDFLADGGH